MPPGRNNAPGMMFPPGPGMRNPPTHRGPGGFPFQNRPPVQSQPAEPKGVGGLISKLLNRSNQQSPSPASFFRPPAAQAAAGAGIIEGLKSPGSITTMLSNTQKILTAAEQLGPMVQQYGPLFKNLPAMWKMYRSLKDSGDSKASEDETPETAEEESAESEVGTNKSATRKKKRLTIQNDQTVQKKTRQQEAPSEPKLYI
jgi:hypothetical protein